MTATVRFGDSRITWFVILLSRGDGIRPTPRQRRCIQAFKAALIETRAKLSGAEAMIEHLQLVLAKMKREMFGPCGPRLKHRFLPALRVSSFGQVQA
jgi:hypothetical protein